ncbi:sodium:proton antiporter, partial [Marinobacter sp. Z-F4-2]
MWVAVLTIFLSLFLSPQAIAAADGQLDLTGTTVGITAIIIFTIAYLLVMGEEHLHMRKSKPVLVAAGLIWMMIGWVYVDQELPGVAETAFRHNLLEFAELMLFLLVAMTYINAMEERRLFDGLRSWMIRKGFS